MFVCDSLSEVHSSSGGIQSCHVHVAFPMLPALPVPTPHGDMLRVSQDLLAAQSSDHWSTQEFCGYCHTALLFKGRRPKSSPCGQDAARLLATYTDLVIQLGFQSLCPGVLWTVKL